MRRSRDDDEPDWLRSAAAQLGGAPEKENDPAQAPPPPAAAADAPGKVRELEQETRRQEKIVGKLMRELKDEKLTGAVRAVDGRERLRAELGGELRAAAAGVGEPAPRSARSSRRRGGSSACAAPTAASRTASPASSARAAPRRSSPMPRPPSPPRGPRRRRPRGGGGGAAPSARRRRAKAARLHKIIERPARGEGGGGGAALLQGAAAIDAVGERQRASAAATALDAVRAAAEASRRRRSASPPPSSSARSPLQCRSVNKALSPHTRYSRSRGLPQPPARSRTRPSVMLSTNRAAARSDGGATRRIGAARRRAHRAHLDHCSVGGGAAAPLEALDQLGGVDLPRLAGDLAEPLRAGVAGR